MGRLFGTDGIRGLANGDLTVELCLAVSAAAARELAERGAHRPVAVVGRDPRASGEMLEAAVVAGLASAGADVLRAGVLPTPAVAHLVADRGSDLGVMISASHNPMPDNGIKLFAAGGHKLPDAVEDAIAARMGEDTRGPTGSAVGRVRDLDDALERYISHLLLATPRPLTGLKVVVDCSNGAAHTAAPAAYQRAGAEVIALHAEPDGLNINDNCGSTYIAGLGEHVLAHGADLGIAHDGDADRCLAVTADGEVVDGDQILAILAVAMQESGELTGNTVVATVMSNLGLHLAMRSAGIDLQTTAVGDRYVLEKLRAGGWALGGEQSGHMILPAFATTGDGLLTALRLMARMAMTGRTLAELAAVLTPMPQVLVSVPVRDKARAVESDAVRSAVAEAEAQLGGTGRVLLRASGTEQVVRVMVEATTTETADAVTRRLVEVVGTVG